MGKHTNMCEWPDCMEKAKHSGYIIDNDGEVCDVIYYCDKHYKEAMENMEGDE